MPKIEDMNVIWSSVNGVMEFLREPGPGLGPDGFDRLVAALPADHRVALTSKHLAWDRVPLVAVNRAVEEAARMKGIAPVTFAHSIGRYCAEQSPILKMFAMLLTPKSAIKVATQAWQKIYGCGSIRAESLGPTSAQVVVTDFPSEPVGCARILGWIEVIAEAAGA